MISGSKLGYEFKGQISVCSDGRFHATESRELCKVFLYLNRARLYSRGFDACFGTFTVRTRARIGHLRIMPIKVLRRCTGPSRSCSKCVNTAKSCSEPVS